MSLISCKILDYIVVYNARQQNLPLYHEQSALPKVLEGAAQEGEASTFVTIEECHSGQRTDFRRASSSGHGRAQKTSATRASAKNVREETLQLGTGASSSQKPSEDDTYKQAKVQHGPAQPAAEVATTVREVKPGQADTEAKASAKPSEGDTCKEAKVQHGPAQPAAVVATTASKKKQQPVQPDTEATASQKPFRG